MSRKPFSSFAYECEKRRFDVLERVIQILMYLANKPEGASIREIARSIGMNPYVCGRYIDNMEKWGLVTKEQRGRAYIVKITDRGLRAVLVASQLLSLIPIDLAPRKAKEEASEK